MISSLGREFPFVRRDKTRKTAVAPWLQPQDLPLDEQQTVAAVIAVAAAQVSTELTKLSITTQNRVAKLSNRLTPVRAQQSDPEAAKENLSQARNQQLGALLTETEQAERNKRLRFANLNIGVATTTLVLSSVGNFYWPLKLLSLPGFLYLFLRNLNRTRLLIQERRMGVPMIGTIVNLGMLSFGYFTYGAVGLLIQQLADKMVAVVIGNSNNTMINIFRQVPKHVWLVLEEGEMEVPLEQVAAGQIVAVRAGEIIPVDGTIIAGIATIDQQLLTGEAKPVDKGAGEEVFAATLVVAGQIQVAVEKAGDETTVAQIGNILNNTIEYKSAIQLRAEELGDRTVIPTMLAGAAAYAFVGPMGALTLMSSHFRRAMSLFGPLSMLSYLNVASQRGILIKDGRSLDLLSEIDTLVFDKTGTLTEEQPTVGAIHLSVTVESLNARSTQEAEAYLLSLAAAAEQKQTHPIARAIRTAAISRELDIPEAEDAAYQIGYGLSAQVADQVVRVGSIRLMESEELAIPATLVQTATRIHEEGYSLVVVACNETVIGGIELVPTVRPEAKAVIQMLCERHNIQSTYIISGDHTVPTQRLTEDLGIDHFYAETLPEQKADLIEQLCQEGRTVCYVGDGINDAIALKKAHVSISLQGASSVAMDTAQVILVNGNLQGLPDLFDFAHEFRRNTDSIFATMLAVSALGMGGALFLNFNLIHAAFLQLIALTAGLTTSLHPSTKYQLNQTAGTLSTKEKE